MNRLFGTIAIALTSIILSCGSGEQDTESTHQALRTLDGINPASVLLEGGTRVDFPANTFAGETIVIVADLLLSTDYTPTYFPTDTPEGGDLLGAMIINTPVDELIQRDISVTFDLKPFNSGLSTSQIGDVTIGQEFAVYRFDFDYLRWNRWGDTSVVVDGGRTVASGTLPTEGMRGFIGSIAIFRERDIASMDDPVQTMLMGRVVDQNGNGISTDVGIYLMVGAVKYAATIDNGRIPNLMQPADGRQPIDKHNTVTSALDGTFTMLIPDNMIGQLINLEFGHETAGRILQEEFDVLAPATPALMLLSTVVRYGDNNVVSRPVEL